MKCTLRKKTRALTYVLPPYRCKSIPTEIGKRLASQFNKIITIIMIIVTVDSVSNVSSRNVALAYVAERREKKGAEVTNDLCLSPSLSLSFSTNTT